MIPDDDDHFTQPNWAMIEVSKCQVVLLEVLTMKCCPDQLFPSDVGLACDCYQLLPVMMKTMGWKGQLVNPVMDSWD
jgi:hypothetical protein